MKKLLRHLTNAPVAVALAFLLVGAPSAPVVNVVPDTSVGVAYANADDGMPDNEMRRMLRNAICENSRNPASCEANDGPYEAALPWLIILAVIGAAGAAVTLADSCRDGVCSDLVDKLRELSESARERHRETLLRYCLRNMDDYRMCDGVYDLDAP